VGHAGLGFQAGFQMTFIVSFDIHGYVFLVVTMVVGGGGGNEKARHEGGLALLL
jgi:hypothetical protein